MEEEIKKLQEMLATLEPESIGYIFVEIEIKEQIALQKSLERLI